MGRSHIKLPTRPWVPQWLGITTVFIVLLPMVLLNGAYTGSTVEVSGTLGALREDMTMAYYSTAAGLAIGYPTVRKFRGFVTSKTILLSDLVLQVFLSSVCGFAKNMDIIIICSFFIGFLKAFVMFEIVTLIRPFFTPKNVRSEFYAWFYPLAFTGGQVSIALTAQLAYYYQWQYMYYLVVILLLVAIVFVLCFFRYLQRPIRLPLREVDWQSILLAASTMLLTICLFTYGRTLDWFASARLRLFAVLIPILSYLFWIRQRTNGGRFINLDIFRSFKLRIGYVFLFCTLLLSSTGTLVNNYVTTVLRIDSVHANALYLGLVPGFAVGGFVCFWWFRWQRWRFRYLVAGSLGCFAVYLALVYFGISPETRYESLFLPVFFRGVGMMQLFIALAMLIVEGLPPQIISSNTFFMVGLRSSLSPAIAVSLFSNWIYRLQIKGMSVLSENMRMDNPVFIDRYNQSFASAIASGHGFDEATLITNQSFYSILQQQSLLLGIKTIIGYMLLFAIVLAVVSAFIPFHKTIKVWTLKTGDDMV